MEKTLIEDSYSAFLMPVFQMHFSSFSKSKRIFILLFFLASGSIHAQNSQVIAHNPSTNTDGHTSILIKWYSPEILYREGINIYRRMEGQSNWEKLNTTPIKLKDDVNPEEILKDEELEFYVNLIKEDGIDFEEEILLFNVLLKSFQSNVFADFLGIYFEDSTAQFGKAYTYRVNKIVGAQETFLGQSQLIKADVFVPAAPVSEFKIVQNKNFFEFDWKIEENRFYAVNLYQTSSDTLGEIKINQNPMVITEIETDSGLVYPSPKFKKRDFKEGVNYTFQIAGVGFFEEETKRTDPISLSFNDITPPLPPTLLKYTQDTMRVDLIWSSPSDPQIDRVVLYRSSYSQGPFEKIADVMGREAYTDEIIVPGPYYYYLSSFDYAGNEAQSKRVFVEIPDQDPPMPPEGVVIAVDTGSMLIRWKVNPELDIKGYIVFRSAEVDSKEHFVLLTGDPLTKAEYRQVLPKNVKNEFSFYVVAIDTADNRSSHSKAVQGRLPDVTAPEKPFIKSVQIVNNRVVLEWTPNVDADLAGYHVYRSDSVKVPKFQRVNQNMLAAQITKYTDRNVLPDKNYFYYLVALDSSGNLSLPSAQFLAKVAAEEDLSGQLKLSLRYKKRKRENRLIWTAPDGDWLGYMVYRGTSSDALKPLTGILKDIQTSYVDKSLSKDALTYQIRAFDKNGHILKSNIESWEK